MSEVDERASDHPAAVDFEAFVTGALAGCSSNDVAPNAADDAEIPGLMHATVGGYHVRDIEFTAAFDVTTDKAPAGAQWIGWAAAAFSFPVLLIALTWLEPLTRAAAAGVGIG